MYCDFTCYLKIIIFSSCLKVHPSSISVEGTLGNLRLCDLSLGSEHYWAWLCDIRNQGAESLIQVGYHIFRLKLFQRILRFSCLIDLGLMCFLLFFYCLFLPQFKFHSYSAEDDDYEGYDYSLQCRLSAVRIVFLYRFVQEVSSIVPIVRELLILNMIKSSIILSYYYN